eukprot:2592221-Rhodomonas_salina.1
MEASQPTAATNGRRPGPTWFSLRLREARRGRSASTLHRYAAPGSAIPQLSTAHRVAPYPSSEPHTA